MSTSGPIDLKVSVKHLQTGLAPTVSGYAVGRAGLETGHTDGDGCVPKERGRKGDPGQIWKTTTI